MQIHLGMNGQDIFGVLAATSPLLLQLFEVVGQGRHDRNINADLGLAHLFTANDQVLQVNFAPLEGTNISFTQSRGDCDSEQRLGEVV